MREIGNVHDWTKLVQNRRSRNLGQTSLSARRRVGQPMRTYDALPSPLRQWLAQAALPWSPTSANRIWQRAQKRGLDVEETLRRLENAETKTLARDKVALRKKIQTLSS